MHIGSLIKRIRLARSISQEALSAMTGLSKQCISRIEVERNEPTIDTLIRVGNALEYPGWKILRKYQKENQDVKLGENDKTNKPRLSPESPGSLE